MEEYFTGYAGPISSSVTIVPIKAINEPGLLR
jgi:hypothetical protein